MSERRQLNVSVPPDLVRRLKHAAIDAQRSLSDLVATVLHDHLERTEHPVTAPIPDGPSPVVRLQPMVHVEDMAASVAFYEALGATVRHGSRDGDWVLLDLGGAQIGLLAHPPNPEQDEGTVELNFAAAVPLPELEARLRSAGVQVVRPTTDEGFGAQLQLASPDGLLVKVNELQPELYT